jgi:hypothetical protein
MEKGESPLQGPSMDTRNSEPMKDSGKGSPTRKANEHGMTIEHGFMSDHGYNTCVQTVYRDAFLRSTITRTWTLTGDTFVRSMNS